MAAGGATCRRRRTATRSRSSASIPVDSIYSPVHRVRYGIEATRVGKFTNYDRLILEVWTDGTVSPQLALTEAAKIYRKHLNPFVLQSETKDEHVRPRDARASEFNLKNQEDERAQPPARPPIADLELSVRARNCLDGANLQTLRDLVTMSENDVINLKNLGKTSPDRDQDEARRARPVPRHDGGRAPPVLGAQPHPRSKRGVPRGAAAGAERHQDPCATALQVTSSAGPTSHRKAMTRNMAASLIEHERIITTVQKAKAVKPFVEKLVTLAKDDSQHNRRRAFSKLRSKEGTVRALRRARSPLRRAARRLLPDHQAGQASPRRQRRASDHRVRRADAPRA